MCKIQLLLRSCAAEPLEEVEIETTKHPMALSTEPNPSPKLQWWTFSAHAESEPADGERCRKNLSNLCVFSETSLVRMDENGSTGSLAASTSQLPADTERLKGFHMSALFEFSSNDGRVCPCCKHAVVY